MVPDPEPEVAQSAEPVDELDYYNEATNQTYIIHDDIADILQGEPHNATFDLANHQSSSQEQIYSGLPIKSNTFQQQPSQNQFNQYHRKSSKES